jgi:hypothetical protein
MRQPGREQDSFGPIVMAGAVEEKCLGFTPEGLDVIVQKLDSIAADLRHPSGEQLVAVDALRKSEIVLYIGFPFRHGSTGVNQQRVTPATAEIYRGGQPG